MKFRQNVYLNLVMSFLLDLDGGILRCLPHFILNLSAGCTWVQLLILTIRRSTCYPLIYRVQKATGLLNRYKLY